jgi:hypothetical protein
MCRWCHVQWKHDIILANATTTINTPESASANILFYGPSGTNSGGSATIEEHMSFSGVVQASLPDGDGIFYVNLAYQWIYCSRIPPCSDNTVSQTVLIYDAALEGGGGSVTNYNICGSSECYFQWYTSLHSSWQNVYGFYGDAAVKASASPDCTNGCYHVYGKSDFSNRGGSVTIDEIAVNP